MSADTAGSEASGVFPSKFLLDFLEFLGAERNRFQFITYDDLTWGDDFDADNFYPQEFERWRLEVQRGERDPGKIHVLLQHDVDSFPERSMAILRHEERLQIPSSVMIFRRRVDRAHLEATGQVRYSEYALDYNYLRRLEVESSFVIGYHSNAYEQALFDRDAALRQFEDDVRELRRHFPLRYFSPHGGPRGPNGVSNNALPVPDSLRRSIRWVHNTKGVRFNGNFSDGGINTSTKDVAERDLRAFVAKWRPGGRYRVLIHPQHYHSPCERSPRLSGAAWYESLLATYEGGMRGSAWEGVMVGPDPL